MWLLNSLVIFLKIIVCNLNTESILLLENQGLVQPFSSYETFHSLWMQPSCMVGFIAGLTAEVTFIQSCLLNFFKAFA